LQFHDYSIILRNIFHILVKMRIIALLFFVISLPLGLFARNSPTKIASIPFQVVGSYIVVEISINGSSPLNLILDTGVSYTIITELFKEDSLTIKYSEKSKLNGLGPNEEIMAYKSNGNNLSSGRMRMTNQTVYVLEKDLFNLSRHVGFKINGLIGSDFFENKIVNIDYNKKKITFYENESFVAPKKYISVPLIMLGHRMFISLPVTGPDWVTKDALMLLDTGAELSAWFRSYGENPIKIPSKKIRGYIGHGLNGEVYGDFGRIYMIKVGSHILYDPIVSFPDSVSISEAIFRTKREGTIGSQILSRFNLIFDQPNNKLYLKPNWNFKKPFSYNIAGIEVVEDDFNFQMPEVINVRVDSPAEHAGVKVGDRIYQINGLESFKTNINEMRKLFETSSKAPLRLVLLRGNQTVDVKIEMKSAL